MLTKLKLKLINGDDEILQKDEVEAILDKQILSFQIEDMRHSLDLEQEIFLRENSEYSFFLDIKNKKSEITLKKEDIVLQVEVEYANLLRNKKEIKISYLIETDDKEYTLILFLEKESE